MIRPVAIVSGGTFGLGRDITLKLAREGFDIVAFGLEGRQVSSIAENGIAETTVALSAAGLAATLLDADTSNEQAVESVVKTALDRHGRIDALVANAAIGPLGTVLDTAPDLWDRVMAVNLRGPYLCARAVIPHMRRAGGGAIVLVASGAGWGKPNMAAYAASKGGVFALAQAMAYDHFHDRIRVNTVVPGGGGIVSGMSVGRVGGDSRKLARDVPGTAAGRVATGADLADAVAFLLSNQAAAISGTVIDVGCFFHQGGPVPKSPPSQEPTP
jgi:NAD(P)-dependent dehydrogenase (short-subunit alcohol dehydrogenase family)